MRALLALFVAAESAIKAALATGGRNRGVRSTVRSILAALRAGAVGTPEKPGRAFDVVVGAYRSAYTEAARGAQDGHSEARDDGSTLKGPRHQGSLERLFRSLALKLDVAIAHAAGDIERSFKGTQEEIPEVKGFTDRAGRRWDLSVYARMCARTTAAEAASEATINRVLDVGGDLVRVSKHPHPRDACSPFEGRVFSISGQSDVFPRLREVPPFHPNCVHRLRPYRQAEPEAAPRVARRNRRGEVRVDAARPGVRVKRGRVYLTETPGAVVVDGEGRVFLTIDELEG